MEWMFTEAELPVVAAAFSRQFAGKKIFAFHGAMGAGKTTFISTLCGLWKIKGSASSPTFSIINEYVAPSGTIYHIDLYRLANEEEAVRAGVEDCLYSGAVCLVEWPERANGLFQVDTVNVWLETTDGNSRRMRVADN